jgi:hypothetical protein
MLKYAPDCLVVLACSNPYLKEKRMIRHFSWVFFCCLLLTACGGGGGGGGGDGDNVAHVEGGSVDLDIDVSGTPRTPPVPSMGALEAG